MERPLIVTKTVIHIIKTSIVRQAAQVQCSVLPLALFSLVWTCRLRDPQCNDSWQPLAADLQQR